MGYRALEEMRRKNRDRWGIDAPRIPDRAAMTRSSDNRETPADGLERDCVSFIRDLCEDLRFDSTGERAIFKDLDGTSAGRRQIPYNMEKDLDRLCLENAARRFLKSGAREDAADIYVCYLDLFGKDRSHPKSMAEMLAELESGGGCGRCAHVFLTGLGVCQANPAFRRQYRRFYGLEGKGKAKAAEHFLRYWGAASLFGGTDGASREPCGPANPISEKEDLEDPLSWLLALCGVRQCRDRTFSGPDRRDEARGADCEPEFGEGLSYVSLDGALKLRVKTELREDARLTKKRLPDAAFFHVYDFAVALNARYRHDGEEDKVSPKVMEEEFRSMSLEYRLSNIHQAEAFFGHMEAAGYVCSPSPLPLEPVRELTPEDLEIIGPLEHLRWLEERASMGWVWGREQPKEIREQTRTHHLMLPEDMPVSRASARDHYKELSGYEAGKDLKPMNRMLKLAERYGGVKIYKKST